MAEENQQNRLLLFIDCDRIIDIRTVIPVITTMVFCYTGPSWILTTIPILIFFFVPCYLMFFFLYIIHIGRLYDFIANNIISFANRSFNEFSDRLGRQFFFNQTQLWFCLSKWVGAPIDVVNKFHTGIGKYNRYLRLRMVHQRRLFGFQQLFSYKCLKPCWKIISYSQS